MKRSRRIVIEERRWAVRVRYAPGVRDGDSFVAYGAKEETQTVLGYATFRSRSLARAHCDILREHKMFGYPVRCTVRLIVEG